MIDFNYEKYYRERTQKETDLVKKTGLMKASQLAQFIKKEDNLEKSVIGEVGTGPGDVLNYFKDFKIRIGMDISLEALQIQINNYFDKIVIIGENSFNLQGYYKKPISKVEIMRGIVRKDLPNEGGLILLKLKPNNPLPFENKAIDYLILCDIVEHVEKPVKFLRDMKRVGKKLLIKIPIEKSLLVLISYWLNNIKYGLNHPSGHLYYWNVKEALELLEKANIKVLEQVYLPGNLEFSQRKSFFKVIVFRTINFLDRILSTKFFLSRILLGGSLFIYAEEKTP